MTAQRKRERPRTTQRAEARQKQRPKARPASRGERPWLLPVGVTLGLVVIAVVFFVINARSSPPAPNPTPPASVLSQLAKVSPETLAAVGSGSATTKGFRHVSEQPLTSDGKPEVLYMGAEYCPYCGAERWALIVALSRFGSFSGVQTLLSAEASVPTFTFRNASYSSPYIAFTPVELYDNAGKPLRQPTSQEAALLSKYATGYPFVDFGNQLSFDGATYNYNLLTTSTWLDIADALGTPSTPQAQGVLGSANLITASICKITGDQPASVCSDPVIQRLKSGLPG